MAHISNKSCDSTSFEMKCLLICLVMSLTASEKLDRTYLPPPGAQLAGGNPGDILAPFEPPYLTQTGFQPIAYGQKIYKEPKEQLIKLPVTTTSYAFTQTTTFPPIQNSETLLPVNGIRLTDFNPGQDNLQYNQELQNTFENHNVNLQPDISKLRNNQNSYGRVNEVLIPGLNINQPGSTIHQPDSYVHRPSSNVEFAGQSIIQNEKEQDDLGNIGTQDQYSDIRNQEVATARAPQGNSDLLNDNTESQFPYKEGASISEIGKTRPQPTPQIQSTLGPGKNIQAGFPQPGYDHNVNLSTSRGYLSSIYSTAIPISHTERPQTSWNRSATILNYENTLTPNSYSYSYDTSNGIHAHESGLVDNGTKAKGSYSYTGDDGKIYTIFYTADENGFQPHGEHLPTPPPIPEAIQKLIEQAARDKEAGIIDDGSYDENKYGYRNYQNPTYDQHVRKNKFGSKKMRPFATIKDKNHIQKESEILVPVNVNMSVRNRSHENEFVNKEYNQDNVEIKDDEFDKLHKDDKISDNFRSFNDLDEDNRQQNNSKPSQQIYIYESEDERPRSGHMSGFPNNDYSENSDNSHQITDALYTPDKSYKQDTINEVSDNRYYNQPENQNDDFGSKLNVEKVSTTPTFTRFNQNAFNGEASKDRIDPENKKGYYNQKSTTPRPFMTSRVSTFRGRFSDYDNDEDEVNDEDDISSTQPFESIDNGDSSRYPPSQTNSNIYTTSTANPIETYSPKFVISERPQKISESLQMVSSNIPVASNATGSNLNQSKRPYFNAVTTNAPIHAPGVQYKDEVNIPAEENQYSPNAYSSTLQPVPSIKTKQVSPDYQSNYQYFKPSQFSPSPNGNQYQSTNPAYHTTHNNNVGYSEMVPSNTPENRILPGPGRYTTISPEYVMTTAVSSTPLQGSTIDSDFPSSPVSQTSSSGYVYEHPKLVFPTNPTISSTFGNTPDFTTPSTELNIKPQQFLTTTQLPYYSPIQNEYNQNSIVDAFGRPIISETHSEVLSPNDNTYRRPQIPDDNVFKNDDGTSGGASSFPGDTPTYNVEQAQSPVQRYPGYNDPDKVIGENFLGPKQPQTYDPQTGYHYK